MNKLTQNDVRRLPDGDHSFGDGLILRVKGASRTWALRIQYQGKRTTRGLGSAFEIPLGKARSECSRLRLEIQAGTAQTKSEKIKAQSAPAKTAFEDIWERAVDVRESVARWKSPKQAEAWKRTIRRYALPVIGKLDVAEISRQDILRIIQPIWETKTETASRVRGRLETIFDWCIREGYREKENPARWRGQLAFDLPSKEKIHEVQHYEAPTLLELQSAVPRLLNSISGKCTLFGILTACRVQEFTKARWEEIDFKRRVWEVSPDRRKDGKPYPYRVPLSDQAIKLLKSIEPENDFVFKGLAGESMAKDTPRMLLIEIIGRGVTMHGCRSTFRDWCAENGINEVVSKKSLMHATGDAVDEAYQRSDLLEQRRPTLQKWADVIFAKYEALRGSSTPSS